MKTKTLNDMKVGDLWVWGPEDIRGQTRWGVNEKRGYGVYSILETDTRKEAEKGLRMFRRERARPDSALELIPKLLQAGANLLTPVERRRLVRRGWAVWRSTTIAAGHIRRDLVRTDACPQLEP